MQLHPSQLPLSALEHGAFVGFGLLIYILVTRIGHQRRHPSAAIAWVIGIAAFPYMGIPLFLLFGTRKFVRPAHVIHATSPLRPAVDAPPWATRLLDGLGLASPVNNESVAFHADGLQAFQALIDLLDRSQHSLEVCTFLIADDKVGNGVCDALIAAAHRGVRTRLLLDWVGTMKTPPRLLNRLKTGGVEVRRFMPLLHNPTRGKSNLRNHRKLVVADKAWLWSGGRNLADEYFLGQKGQAAWTDLSFVVQGLVAVQAAAQFEQDWALAGTHRPMHLPTQPKPALNPGARCLAQWIPCGPDHAQDTVHALLMAGAYHAVDRLLAVTPYFVPDEALLDAWCMACRRGVQVRLVIPQRSNHRLADWARERALRQLVEAGAQVFMTRSMIHAKAVVIDHDLALCGSVNLDGRSLFLNFEVMTAFYGATEVRWLADWIDEQASHAITYRAQRPPWWRDLAEGLVRAVGFQL